MTRVHAEYCAYSAASFRAFRFGGARYFGGFFGYRYYRRSRPGLYCMRRSA